MRIAKITSPVKSLIPDHVNVPMPIEGELAMRYTYSIPGNRGLLTTEPRPWTLGPKNTKHEAIQDLLRDQRGN